MVGRSPADGNLAATAGRPLVRLELDFPAGPPEEAISMAKQAEAAGIARLGVWDSPALFREPWVTLAVVATATRTASIGVNVTNPLTRHPVVTASAAATLAELAPGRVFVGIGSGDSGVYNLGLKAAPIAYVRDYIIAVRELLTRGETVFQGRRAILPWAEASIPIYMAAHGANSIRTAGQVADGVLIGLGLDEYVVGRSLELLAEGAREGGRDPGAIDVWWYNSGVYIDPIPGKAEADASWIVAAPAHHLAKSTMKGKLVPAEYEAGIRILGEAYDVRLHGNVPHETRAFYEELAVANDVKRYLARRFLIAGTDEEVVARLDRLARIGANQISIGGVTNFGIGPALECAALVRERLSGVDR